MSGNWAYSIAGRPICSKCRHSVRSSSDIRLFVIDFKTFIMTGVRRHLAEVTQERSGGQGSYRDRVGKKVGINGVTHCQGRIDKVG